MGHSEPYGHSCCDAHMVYLQILFAFLTTVAHLPVKVALTVGGSIETWLLLLNPWFMLSFDISIIFTLDTNH